MEMEDFYKDINQLKRSLRTLRKYHEEAEGCSDKGLHLAACILWGICVEAALLSCALTEIDEIKKENLWPRDEEGKEKDVKDWGLNDLLTIAQKKWFKDRVSTKEIERIRKLQNSRNIFTHPAAYLFKREKKRISFQDK
jgi:hypothetical protein